MVCSYIRVSTISQHVMNQRLQIESFAKQRGFEIDREIAVEVSSRKSLEKRRITELVDRIRLLARRRAINDDIASSHNGGLMPP